MLAKLQAWIQSHFIRVVTVEVPVEVVREVVKEVLVEKEVRVEVLVEPADPHAATKDLVKFMKEQGAHKFTSGTVSVEFGIDAVGAPKFLDDKAQQMAELRSAIASVADDEKTNLAWSV